MTLERLLPGRWGSLHRQVLCQALSRDADGSPITKILGAATSSGQELNSGVSAFSVSISGIIVVATLLLLLLFIS